MELLQIYWWILISLIGGLLVFMFFVQGGQTLAVELGQNEIHKDMMINSVGRKWDLTYTTLVLFGGACFAAFPLFYSTSFGGAYWVWLAILFCFTIQAVSYEFRKKANNFLGQKVYEIFLYINGSLGIILIGIAVSTFFSGSGFSLDYRNFVTWDSPLRGLEALFNPFNYLLGFAIFFLARIGGALYFINNINDEDLRVKLRKTLIINVPLFLVFFLGFVAWLLTTKGFAIAEDGAILVVSYKYLLNFLEMPIVLAIFLLGVILVLVSIYLGLIKKSIKGIWFYCPGVVFAVMSVLLVAGLNNTAFYPSYSNLQSSLTIYNASSSQYTLGVMAVISLFVVVVLGYISYCWYSMDAKKITKAEVQSSDELY